MTPEVGMVFWYTFDATDGRFTITEIEPAWIASMDENGDEYTDTRERWEENVRIGRIVCTHTLEIVNRDLEART